MNPITDYQKAAYQSVDRLFNDIDQLRHRGKYLGEEQQQMFNQKVNDLAEKKEKLRKKYNLLSSSAGPASEVLKNGFEQAKDVLTSAWREAKDEFAS